VIVGGPAVLVGGVAAIVGQRQPTNHNVRRMNSGEPGMTLLCPRCSSSDLVPTGRSVLDGKRTYRCNTCQLDMAPMRSRIALWLVLIFGLVMTLAGVVFVLVLAYLVLQPVEPDHAQEPRTIRVPILLATWPVAAGLAVFICIRELRRPTPVRSLEDEIQQSGSGPNWQ
jgi:hypothetical protein